jgi:pyruvate/2-oxoglutarate/acetoin dehydrogenase E1 component
MEVILSEAISNKCEEMLIKKEGLILGQCLSAVGWVGGTVPKLPGHPGIVELSMADVSGGGIAVGAALNNTRPVVYVIRYQGFLWYNAISIVNYAAKSMELFNVPCPLLVRAIAMEGAIGPVAGGSHHSLLLRMPGLNVVAPMTPKEWNSAWDFHFTSNTNPTILSEHRLSYKISRDFVEHRSSAPQVTILGISAGRLSAFEATEELIVEGFQVDLFHLVWLAPLELPDGFLDSLRISRFGVIVDSDYESWGTAESLAFQILKLVPGVQIEVLGLARKSAGFSNVTDNITPSSKGIINTVKQNLS